MGQLTVERIEMGDHPRGGITVKIRDDDELLIELDLWRGGPDEPGYLGTLHNPAGVDFEDVSGP